MKSPITIFCLAVLLISRVAVHAAAPEGWTEDYAKALEQAKTEHKKVLLDFTGSDWCGWCKKIDAEVFETQKFKDYAAKHLVLVKLDFPHSTPQSDEIKAQNKKLRAEHKVSGLRPSGGQLLHQHESQIATQWTERERRGKRALVLQDGGWQGSGRSWHDGTQSVKSRGYAVGSHAGAVRERR